MRNLFVLVGCLMAVNSYARPIRVAVIDTGLSASAKVHICKTGHRDLVGDQLVEPHGTNVSGLIERYADNANYCQIIIRWFKTGISEQKAKYNLALSIKHAIDVKADIINISAGGVGSDPMERKYIKMALDKGILVVVAAGNEGYNLDKNCNYFPACYDKRIVVIGNLKEDGQRHFTSNYGKVVTHYVVGTDRCAEGYCMTGTSQATAVATGRLIHDMYASNYKKKRAVAGK